MKTVYGFQFRRFDLGLYGSLTYLHKPVLDSKKIILMNGSCLTGSNRTVRCPYYKREHVTINILRAFRLGLSNAIRWYILAFQFRKLLLSGFLIVKKFTIVLQDILNVGWYRSSIAKLQK